MKKIITCKKPTKAQAEQFDMLFPILDAVFMKLKNFQRKTGRCFK